MPTPYLTLATTEPIALPVRATTALLWRPSTAARPGAQRWAFMTAEGHPLTSPVERFLVHIPPAPGAAAASDRDARTIPIVLRLDPLAVATARRTLTVILEVWAFRRPAAHVDSLVEPTVARYVRVVAENLRARREPGTALCSIRICQPHAHAAEVAAVCRIGGRPRALAARFEYTGTWRCRAIRLG